MCLYLAQPGRFCLDFTDSTDKRTRICRRRGKQFQAANIAEYDRYGGGSVMVWGGISWEPGMDEPRGDMYARLLWKHAPAALARLFRREVAVENLERRA